MNTETIFTKAQLAELRETYLKISACGVNITFKDFVRQMELLYMTSPAAGAEAISAMLK